MWRHSESDHLQAEGKALGENNPANTFTLYFQIPELWENKFLLFESPSLWYLVFCYGSLGD